MSSRKDIAVSVQGLSKSYTIAHEQEKQSTLAETLLQRARHPFRRTSKETFWALKDVSFDIKKGDVVGIIGRNGAGKSTLLKILSRITEPTSGRIKLYGRVGSLLEVGTGFHPELTGRENIYLNGAILGMTRAEIRKHFDVIVSFAGVENFLDTPVKRYSSGMYVRLAFAVAAHLNSEILIIDEVLAVGDAEFQKKCLGKMKDVSLGGRTVLFVSHNIDAVMRLCNRGIYLKTGKVVNHSTIKPAVDAYLTDAATQRVVEKDLAILPRPAYVAQSSFKIIKYLAVTQDGNATFAAGTPIRIQLHYRYETPIEGLRVGVGLNTIYGQRIATFHTPVDSDFVKVNGVSVEIEIDTESLKPGEYSVDLGARSGQISYDSLEQVGWLQIGEKLSHEQLDDVDNFGVVNIRHHFVAR